MFKKNGIGCRTTPYKCHGSPGRSLVRSFVHTQWFDRGSGLALASKEIQNIKMVFDLSVFEDRMVHLFNMTSLSPDVAMSQLDDVQISPDYYCTTSRRRNIAKSGRRVFLTSRDSDVASSRRRDFATSQRRDAPKLQSLLGDDKNWL